MKTTDIRGQRPLTIVALALCCLVATACGGKDDIVIEGTLQNGAGKTVYIEEMTPESRLFLDSITLDSRGHFKFRYTMPYKTFYNVHVSDADYIVLLPDAGEHIRLTADYDSLSHTYYLTAGHDSQLLWQLQRYSNEGVRQLRDIVSTDMDNRTLLDEGRLTARQFDEAHALTDSAYLATFSQQQKYVVNFIEENLGSLATLIALYKPFNNRPLVDPENSFEVYTMVLDGLEESLPENPHTLNFRNEVERLRYHYGR